MSAGPEADELVGILQVGPPLEVFRLQRATSTSISFGAGLPASGEMFRPVGRDSTALGMVSPSRFRLRIRQWCGRSRISRSSATFRIAFRAHPSGSAYKRRRPFVRLTVGRAGRPGACSNRLASGACRAAASNTPGSLRLKWSEKIRSSAARVSGSFS